jgi:hypothetical protein
MTVTRAEGTEGDLVVHTARPMAAAGLSVLWPGLGHAFLGRTAPAVGFVLAQVVVVVLSVLPGFLRVTVPVWALLVIWSAWSAWRTAHGAQRGRDPVG